MRTAARAAEVRYRSTRSSTSTGACPGWTSPRQRLGVEYDGGDHFATPEAARADARRHTRLAAVGSRVLRYTAAEMRHEPARIVDEVRRDLGLARRDATDRELSISPER